MRQLRTALHGYSRMAQYVERNTNRAVLNAAVAAGTDSNNRGDSGTSTRNHKDITIHRRTAENRHASTSNA